MTQNWRARFEKLNLDPEQCTCLKCLDDQTCPYAFDVYNYEGDCLGEHKTSKSGAFFTKHLQNFFIRFG